MDVGGERLRFVWLEIENGTSDLMATFTGACNRVITIDESRIGLSEKVTVETENVSPYYPLVFRTRFSGQCMIRRTRDCVREHANFKRGPQCKHNPE